MPQTLVATRDHRFDGSKRRNGLSRLMVDTHNLMLTGVPFMDRNTEASAQDEKIRGIIEQVCFEAGITEEQVKARKRSHEIVMARSLIFFIIRMTTDTPLKKMGKMLSNSLPKDHSTVIHGSKSAFNLIHIKDKEFGVLLYRVRQRLSGIYGIEFDLNDWGSLPKWYIVMARKYYKKQITAETLPFIEDIKVNPSPKVKKESFYQKLKQYENKIVERNDVTDKELKDIAKQKGVIIKRKWGNIPNTMWWMANELGICETRLGNTNELCKEALMKL